VSRRDIEKCPAAHKLLAKEVNVLDKSLGVNCWEACSRGQFDMERKDLGLCWLKTDLNTV
jgi:hypothetical protein